MNKIERMLQELCPNGVEYKKLEDICECYAGATPNTKRIEYWENGTIPWMSSGEVNKGVVWETEKKITQLGYDSSSTKMVPANTVVVALAGQGKTRGSVAIVRIPLCTNQSLCSLVTKGDVNPDFLYHYLKGQYLTLRKISSGDGTRGGLNLKMINAFEIPVPPLPIQEEIVRILDHFTALTAELQAELQARQEQYEYYRNKLLTFNILPPPTTSTEVRWMKMSEICSVYTGGEMPKSSIVSDVKTGLYKYPIYANGKDVYGYSDSYRIKDDAVCISSIGANAGTVFFKKGCFTPIIRLKVIVPITNMVNTKYLYYAVSTLRIKTKGNGGIPNINANDIKKLLVPIPSFSEQQRIVSILDKFETLVNDLSQGLPAEIAAVQEQYEYYRNKLLTFKRIA